MPFLTPGPGIEDKGRDKERQEFQSTPPSSSADISYLTSFFGGERIFCEENEWCVHDRVLILRG